MNKDTELSIACYKLMQAIQKGNKTLTNYEKKWEAYKLQNQKLKNLRKKAQ